MCPMQCLNLLHNVLRDSGIMEMDISHLLHLENRILQDCGIGVIGACPLFLLLFLFVV